MRDDTPPTKSQQENRLAPTRTRNPQPLFSESGDQISALPACQILCLEGSDTGSVTEWDKVHSNILRNVYLIHASPLSRPLPTIFLMIAKSNELPL